MRKRVFGASLVLMIAGISAQAACVLTGHAEITRGGWPRVFWDPVAGADRYHVEILRDNEEHVRSQDIAEPSIDVRFQTADRTVLYYRVTAESTTDRNFERCSTVVPVVLERNANFRNVTRRLIIPIAGSAPGANGAYYRTSLRLTSNVVAERGRLIFHNFDDHFPYDPKTLRYDLGHSVGESVFYEDIVAQMGGSGIGYIEVVPDDDTVGYMPSIETRVYNDSPEGTFGGFVDTVNPIDFTSSSLVKIDAADPRFRMNIGIIAMGPTYGSLQAVRKNGTVIGFTNIALNPGTATMIPAATFAGFDRQAGDVIRFVAVNGSQAILFYTLTDNTTNDPQVFVPSQNTKVINVNTALQ